MHIAINDLPTVTEKSVTELEIKGISPIPLSFITVRQGFVSDNLKNKNELKINNLLYHGEELEVV